MTAFLPDSYNLASIQMHAIHLGNKDGSHCLVQCCTIHVDGGTNWQNKPCHTLVYAIVLLQTTECNWQGCWAVMINTRVHISGTFLTWARYWYINNCEACHDGWPFKLVYKESCSKFWLQWFCTTCKWITKGWSQTSVIDFCYKHSPDTFGDPLA